MNTHVIHNGRLVQDPRFFNTKAEEEMASIRLADNPIGKRPEEYQTMFVEVTLPPGLTKVLRDREVGKGDVVMVEGELEIKTYERKKAKRGESKVGLSYEIRFPKGFLILTQKNVGDGFPPSGKGAPAPEPEDDDEGGENAFDKEEE